MRPGRGEAWYMMTWRSRILGLRRLSRKYMASHPARVISGLVASGFGKVDGTYGTLGIGRRHALVTAGFHTTGIMWVMHGTCEADAGSGADASLFRLTSARILRSRLRVICGH